MESNFPPLRGYRVLEIAQLLAGPPSGMYLADMGADVIIGPEGPWRDKPGLDAPVQAVAAFMATTGEPDGGPALCGAPVVDTMEALLATQGIRAPAPTLGQHTEGVLRELGCTGAEIQRLRNTRVI